MDVNSSNSERYFSHPPKVLLVEDTVTIQIANQYLLQELGCHIDIANDGVEATQMTYQDYDLIFMDLMMPNMDGFTATKLIKKESKNKSPIIIGLTTSNEYKQFCLENGFDDFYIKPVNADCFKEIFKKWLPHLINHKATVRQDNTMQPISVILKTLLEEANIYEAELARHTGIGQPNINRIISGKTYNHQITTLRPIAKFFGISISQLIGDEPLPKNRLIGSRDLSGGAWCQIPLLEWEEISIWPNQNETLKFKPLISTDYALNEDIYALRVTNTTMEPQFPPNTILIVDPKLSPQDQDYVIVSLKDQAMPIFRQILMEGYLSYLKSLNPTFKTIQMKSTHQILGVVVQTKTELRKNILCSKEAL